MLAVNVNFGIPTALIRRLIRLPLRWLYEVVDKFWKGFAVHFHIHPWRTDYWGL